MIISLIKFIIYIKINVNINTNLKTCFTIFVEFIGMFHELITRFRGKLFHVKHYLVLNILISKNVSRET